MLGTRTPEQQVQALESAAEHAEVLFNLARSLTTAAAALYTRKPGAVKLLASMFQLYDILGKVLPTLGELYVPVVDQPVRPHLSSISEPIRESDVLFRKLIEAQRTDQPFKRRLLVRSLVEQVANDQKRA